jgi:FlaA1/EpsC-like NDP-sugar epimerase
MLYRRWKPSGNVIRPPLLVIVLLSVAVWYVGARIFLLYGEITIFSFSQEMTVFLRQLATHLLILTFLLFLFYTEFYQYRSLLLYYHMLIFVSLPFEKYFYRVLVAYVRRQYKYEKNILIVGRWRTGHKFLQVGYPSQRP